MIRYVAASVLAIEIAIHVKLAPDHLHEIPYIGAGFVVASVLLALAAFAVLRGEKAGWLLGSVVCLGMAGSFVLSRTTGLPGFHEAWTSDGDLGLYALAGEAAFLVCALQAIDVRGLAPRHAPLHRPAHRRERVGVVRAHRPRAHTAPQMLAE